uniref:Uncharacterized protein n=1 Tax=Rhizophora mucronata TaxID=61149 RepID=A0A2P2NPJ6_RHIMU
MRPCLLWFSPAHIAWLLLKHELKTSQVQTNNLTFIPFLGCTSLPRFVILMVTAKKHSHQCF